MTEPDGCGIVVMPFPDGARTIVVIAGEADVSTASSLQHGVIGTLAYGGRHLVLDLTDLDFCDLHGVDALSAAMSEAEGRGMAVSMRGQSPQVARLLRTYAGRT